eukprot:TRINITY_DN19340_c0_g1_i1.p1 TRINITY_DN19340_c0_g1~~TRINITY_DN19340_c0_g1_i1.p1  ORF type:complete len:266 (+),score=16.63 TRINITY_DN19340_c0_g1_i1:58-855(+)
METCAADHAGRTSVAADSFETSAFSMDRAGPPRMKAPSSKSQKRLHRRRMAWLTHVAYDRITLLNQGASTCDFASCPLAARTPLKEKRLIGTVQSADLAAPQSRMPVQNSVGLISSAPNASLPHDSVVNQIAQEVSPRHPTLVVRCQTAYSLEDRSLMRAVGSLTHDDLCKYLSKLAAIYDEVLAKTTLTPPLLCEDEILCEEDWLQTGTIAMIIDTSPYVAALFSSYDGIGTVVQQLRGARAYLVRLLSTWKNRAVSMSSCRAA